MAEKVPKKLIEVALPLDEINKAAAREKSIRHGHPSTLHLWWARRPLAAARAVLFAQLVNDPSWKYSEEELKKPSVKGAITKKRNDLFRLITELVQWESTTNERVLERARAEIRASWRETCEANRDHPEAATLFNPEKLPEFHDPFAGGGAIPLEAQRLGLVAHATDLNPVAVLINKAMVELPPKFVGQAPVGPEPNTRKQTKAKVTENWSGSRGLAEDVRRYGEWLRNEAIGQLSELYPQIRISDDLIERRPDLHRYVGRDLTVIAWIWARMVVSPNPAAKGRPTPLVTSLFLSKKKNKTTWVQAIAGTAGPVFTVQRGEPPDRSQAEVGTRSGKAQDFICIYTGSPVTRDYIREEGKAGRLDSALMAIACEGDNERVYLSPMDSDAPTPGPEQLKAAAAARSTFLSGTTPSRAMITGGVCSAYGLDTWGSLFSDRQLTFLGTAARLLDQARQNVERDARAGGVENAAEYGEAIATFLSFALSRSVDRGSTLCSWDSSPKMEALRNTFGRQALPMVWDYAEGNPFSRSSGSWINNVDWVARAVANLPGNTESCAGQADAQSVDFSRRVVSTDPPYYDNISYAELSDFFYVWLRRALPWESQGVLSTILTPKSEELVVAPHRHDDRGAAERFFLEGMTQVVGRAAVGAEPTIPMTIYYAFKQSETKDDGTGSTGWESFLSAVVNAGLKVVGTWPMRTELGNRMVSSGTNALASSIVLVCRARPTDASAIARKDFLRELNRALPMAIAEMTADPIAAIAPVDLAQACIGPGMAIFSRYKSILEADGQSMSIHNALVHINKAVDEYFAEAEGELDADSRFCIGWFEQHGFDPGSFGEADVLARAKGTSVDGVREAGVIESGKGKVRLYKIGELPKAWDPTKDLRRPVWEALHHLCRALGDGEGEAGALLAKMPEMTDPVRQLAYRLYTLCERKGWAERARAYNELITSWPEIVKASQAVAPRGQIALV
jgi:putative DNA methylase